MTADYYTYYYYPTHTRTSPWLIGLLAGAVFYELRDKKLEIKWVREKLKKLTNDRNSKYLCEIIKYVDIYILMNNSNKY